MPDFARGQGGDGVLVVGDGVTVVQAQTLYRSLMALPLPEPVEILKLVPACCAGIRACGAALKYASDGDGVAKYLERIAKAGGSDIKRCATQLCEAAVGIYTRELIKDAGSTYNVKWIYTEVNRRLRKVASLPAYNHDSIWATIARAGAEEGKGDLAPYMKLLNAGLMQTRGAADTLLRVFRGVRLPLRTLDLLKASAGKLVVVPTFQSFSESLLVARGFPVGGGRAPAGAVDVFFELQSYGRPTVMDHATQGLKYEREVLLHPFSVFKVASATTRLEDRPLVILEEVEQQKALPDPAPRASGEVVLKFRIDGEKAVRKAMVKPQDSVKTVLAGIMEDLERQDLAGIRDEDECELLGRTTVGQFAKEGVIYVVVVRGGGAASSSGGGRRSVAVPVQVPAGDLPTPVAWGQTRDGLLVIRPEIQPAQWRALAEKVAAHPPRSPAEVLRLGRATVKGILAEDAAGRIALGSLSKHGLEQWRCSSDADEVVHLAFRAWSMKGGREELRSLVWAVLNDRLRETSVLERLTADSIENGIGAAAGELTAYALLLVEAIRRLPGCGYEKGSKVLKEKTAYRGASLPEAIINLYKRNIGKWCVLPTFQSYSLNRDVALRFPLWGDEDDPERVGPEWGRYDGRYGGPSPTERREAVNAWERGYDGPSPMELAAEAYGPAGKGRKDLKLVVFVLQNAGGYPLIAEYSEWPAQQEVLLPPGCVLQVVAVNEHVWPRPEILLRDWR